MSTIPHDPATGEVLEPPARRPFAAWLNEQRKGGLAADLAEMFAEINLAVAETGKAGSLTLSITVKPNGKDGVKITDKVKRSVPEADRGETMFYVDDNGNLSRNDPRQPVLPMGVDDINRRREGVA